MNTQTPVENQSRSHILCTAFAGSHLIASGELDQVVAKVKESIDRGEESPVLIFDDATGRQIEVDFRGSVKDVLRRLAVAVPQGSGRHGNEEAPLNEAAPRGPGRPKLGVVGREVTLLPRHWEWLDDQPGGASVTIRKLVEEAKRANAGRDRVRKAQEAAYRFMVAVAGNLAGFEEATRILFSKEKNRLVDFKKVIRNWPEDIRKHTIRLVGRTMDGASHGEAPADRQRI